MLKGRGRQGEFSLVTFVGVFILSFIFLAFILSIFFTFFPSQGRVKGIMQNLGLDEGSVLSGKVVEGLEGLEEGAMLFWVLIVCILVGVLGLLVFIGRMKKNMKKGKKFFRKLISLRD